MVYNVKESFESVNHGGAMPELPDVEALRRYLLAQHIVGRRITATRLGWPKGVQVPSPPEFTATLQGLRIRDIQRRAKFLLFPLDCPTLIVHLRMTGSLEVVPLGVPPDQFAHNVFTLDDGRELRFRDPRKLGVLWLVDDTGPVLGHLGPEPLEPGFTVRVLEQRLKGVKVPIKPLLCEQDRVAGIGNMYADEILFCSGIAPLRRAGELTSPEVKRLHACIREVLQRAIEGLSRLMPLAGPPSETELGSQVLALPRREEAPCPQCSTPLRRVVLRGRSAYFCSKCQR